MQGWRLKQIERWLVQSTHLMMSNLHRTYTSCVGYGRDMMESGVSVTSTFYSSSSYAAIYCKRAGNNQELSGTPGMEKFLAKMEKGWIKKFLVKGRLFLPAVCLCLHLTSYCTGVQAAVIQVDWHSHHPTLCFCKIVTTHKTANISTAQHIPMDGSLIFLCRCHGQFKNLHENTMHYVENFSEIEKATLYLRN
jgi:hypothetical protein